MRKYEIQLQGKAYDAVIKSTNEDGSTNPGALDIEFDIPVVDFASPTGYAYLKIWGLPLVADKTTLAVQDILSSNSIALGPSQLTISQATDFNWATITISAGMGKGLPLANSDQYGILLTGQVFQAYGNWVETEMTVDLVIIPNYSSLEDAPINIVLDWKKGTKLADALLTTLTKAFPNLPKPAIKISDNLVLTEDDQTQYATLGMLAQHVKDTSLSIIGGNYLGVSIAVAGESLIVFDGTTKEKATQIAFTDMIGQPTWIGVLQVQANLVLRHDIQVGDFIQFPQGIPTIGTAQEVGQQVSDRTAFQGTFEVIMVRHVGRFRQPEASSWVTTINAIGQQIEAIDTSNIQLVPPIPPNPPGLK